MFDQPGRKIKFLAKVFFYLALMLNTFVTGVMIYCAFALDLGSAGLALLFGGIWVFAFGVFFAWVLSLFLYGFGELVDDTEDIRQTTEDLYNLIGRKK